jgi:hypothetical protein
MRRSVVLLSLFVVISYASHGAAQDQPDADQAEPEAATRTGLIEQEEDAKAAALVPAGPGKAEQYVNRLSEMFLGQQARWHAYWDSAYAGGGFTMGAGYLWYTSPYNTLDVRGSITFSGYKRLEAEFVDPELFGKRGRLSVLGGWREATEVGFYGFGMETTDNNRTNYSFQQPYIGATLEIYPTRRLFLVRGGLELSQWRQNPGSGDVPSVDQVYTPETLPGLGARPVYWHTQATIGLDSREPGPGYSRRGGFYGVTVHDYADHDSAYGFNEVDYEVIQHIPILRETWVVSLHGLAETTSGKDGQQIPFFMTPAVGGGSELRAYNSWRLRDLNSLLLQAEWRVMVNRFVDMAVFYDTGKVAARRQDLDLRDMKTDVGLGFRFHGPAATPLRIEVAHGQEGFGIVFAASEAF